METKGFCFENKIDFRIFSVFLSYQFKSFLSLMLVQVFVALILLLIFSLDIRSNNLFSKFILKKVEKKLLQLLVKLLLINQSMVLDMTLNKLKIY